MLSLKRLLIKMLESMATKAVTFTYVSNSCVASNLFSGRGWRSGNIVSANISYNNGTVYMRITTDGNIQIYNATGSPTGWFRLSASYIV